MDDAGYAEARYKEVKEIVEKMLKMVGYNVSKVTLSRYLHGKATILLKNLKI